MEIVGITLTNEELRQRRRVIDLKAQIKGKFLKGPIPWLLIQRATLSESRTQALPTYLVIWFLAQMNGSPRVKFQHCRMKELGISRRATYRAIKQLEKNGLITVLRHKGQSPIVTLLNCQEEGLNTSGGQI